jgi:hypothetical protein
VEGGDMRFPLKWHMDCFANWCVTVERKELEIKRLQTEVERSKKELGFYGFQIANAELNRLDGFDKEKYRVPRKKKEAVDE